MSEKVILPNGREATIVSRGGKYSILRFEDGREVPYPNDKLPQEQTDEPEFNMVVIPAIERLEEFMRDIRRIGFANDFRDNNTMTDLELGMFDQLLTEAEGDLNKKWGLI